jgi:hypothetical protein
MTIRVSAGERLLSWCQCPLTCIDRDTRASAFCAEATDTDGITVSAVARTRHLARGTPRTRTTRYDARARFWCVRMSAASSNRTNSASSRVESCGVVSPSGWPHVRQRPEPCSDAPLALVTLTQGRSFVSSHGRSASSVSVMW